MHCGLLLGLYGARVFFEVFVLEVFVSCLMDCWAQGCDECRLFPIKVSLSLSLSLCLSLSLSLSSLSLLFFFALSLVRDILWVREEEKEERIFRGYALNENDPERDRATHV
jgi:hypothetical protein